MPRFAGPAHAPIAESRERSPPRHGRASRGRGRPWEPAAQMPPAQAGGADESRASAACRTGCRRESRRCRGWRWTTCACTAIPPSRAKLGRARLSPRAATSTSGRARSSICRTRLWHVVQQKQGRVGTTARLNQVGINDDKRLEREADAMGAAALAAPRTSLHAPPPSDPGRPPAMVAQRTVEDDLAGLEAAYQGTNDPLLRKILAEARGLSDIEFSEQRRPRTGSCRAPAARRPARARDQHRPRHRGAVRRQSLVLHEMIHVSADRRYNANRIGEPDPALTAVVNPNQSKQEQLAAIGKQARFRYALAEALHGRVDGDAKLSKPVRAMVKDRLEQITWRPTASSIPSRASSITS